MPKLQVGRHEYQRKRIDRRVDTVETEGIILMDFGFNETKDEQIIARAIRFRSHS